MEDDLPDDWYALLVEQSRTDHIYNLIHEGLSHDFDPQDPDGIVLIHPADLPDKLFPLPVGHIAKGSVVLDENGLVLLKNICLTDYLEAGVCMEIYEGSHYSYALLKFYREEEASDDSGLDYTYNRGKTIDIDNPENVFDEDDPLLFCWDLITRGENRYLALEYAKKGEAILDKKKQNLSEWDHLEFVRICSGYNIVSVAYIWNDLFENVPLTDSLYIHNPLLWPAMKKVLEPYLELLIAKKHTPYLQHLFENVEFKAFFLPHYEAFISLLVNPHYECNRMREMISIINRINNGTGKYL